VRYLTALSLIALGTLLAGCATEHQRALPAYEKPLAHTEYQSVRTTAYFDGEADHLKYTNHNALGTCLQYGHVNSAAADWSRWPAGTMFRVLQNGRTYVVDDYGWDLAGTNTIDIYQPSRRLMDDWGVRHVDIQILKWGDPNLSYETLVPRSDYRHVRLMIAELKPELNHFPVQTGTIPPEIRPVGAPEYEPVASTTTTNYTPTSYSTSYSPRAGYSRSSSSTTHTPASQTSATTAVLTPFY
jgi:3D (Asp-Asp-Asp) domain-containing protein